MLLFEISKVSRKTAFMQVVTRYGSCRVRRDLSLATEASKWCEPKSLVAVGTDASARRRLVDDCFHLLTAHAVLAPRG